VSAPDYESDLPPALVEIDEIDPIATYGGAEIARRPAVRQSPKPRAASRPRTATPRPAARAATAASRRVGGDHPVWFVLQIIGLLVVIASALTISASALVVVGGWQQTPDVLDPVTVAMIDGPMLVAFLCSITFKWRGFGGWLVASRAFGIVMTAFSAAANFAYTVSASAAVNGTTGLSTYQEVTGAIVHASAPVLVNVCFEFFGQVITRPKRDAARVRKMTVKELRKVEREISARLREADRLEQKALRG
jgi:hypothetical protein